MRVARIELASLAWKAGILATIRHPQKSLVIVPWQLLLVKCYNILMSLLSQFTNPDTPEFHSHAIAKADSQQARTIGSTDKSTFSQRKSLEHNRQMVPGYQSAGLLETYRQEARFHQTDTSRARHHPANTQQTPEIVHRTNAAGTPPIPPSQQAPSIPKTSFSEPQARKYNPYS